MILDRRVRTALAVGLVIGAVLGATGATTLGTDDRRAFADHRVWVDDTVTAVSDGTATLDVRSGTVTLVTDAGLLLVPGESGYQPGDWSSVESGTRVCVEVVVENGGRPEVARAFAGATCTVRPVG
jgi:hypothetical protein